MAGETAAPTRDGSIHVQGRGPDEPKATPACGSTVRREGAGAKRELNKVHACERTPARPPTFTPDSDPGP